MDRLSSPFPGPSGSVNGAEISQFQQYSQDWWQEDGPFAPLHRLTPARMAWIKAKLIECFRPGPSLSPPDFSSLKAVDVGCGGGLVSEPLARLGLKVTGIDADAKALEVARAHSAAQGLAVTYKCSSAEALCQAGFSYDVVVALEVVEHVHAPEAFINSLVQLTKPGGLLLLSTLNRTLKSWLFGIVGAEYLLQWVPIGTHHWKNFLTPAELSQMLRRAGAFPSLPCGLVFQPLSWNFYLDSADLSVNYLLAARKPPTLNP
jgi:2-polyprenyl-6-hydroxyphenyl methylase / 3-demethylubiquinone-9 3-methyltransferase